MGTEGRIISGQHKGDMRCQRSIRATNGQHAKTPFAGEGQVLGGAGGAIGGVWVHAG